MGRCLHSLRRFDEAGVVAGCFDGMEKHVRGGGAFDLCGVGGDVDGDIVDAGEGAEGLVDAGGAAFAVHIVDLKGGHGRSPC